MRDRIDIAEGNITMFAEIASDLVFNVDYS